MIFYSVPIVCKNKRRIGVRYQCHFVRLEILRHIERELIETGLGGTVSPIKVVGDGPIIPELCTLF
jgi:hypothetical protein